MICWPRFTRCSAWPAGNSRSDESLVLIKTMDAELYELSGRLGDALKARRLMMAAAESCTGGWIGQAVTMVPGSSKRFDRGFVTYTDEAKQGMLGVGAETLKEFG